MTAIEGHNASYKTGKKPMRDGKGSEPQTFVELPSSVLEMKDFSRPAGNIIEDISVEYSNFIFAVRLDGINTVQCDMTFKQSTKG